MILSGVEAEAQAAVMAAAVAGQKASKDDGGYGVGKSQGIKEKHRRIMVFLGSLGTFC